MALNPASASSRMVANRGLDTERRIAWLTLLIGLAAGASARILGHSDWAAGLVIGAVLAWFNFRWLRRGLDALVVAAKAQEGAAKPRVPVSTYMFVLFRYGLIALIAYVIFEYLHIPLASLVLGMCALGAATLAASLYEILQSRG